MESEVQPAASEAESDTNVANPKPPSSPNPQAAQPASKLDSLPREDLIKLLRKQLIATKDARKQAEEYKQQVTTLEQKCTKLEEAQKDDKTEMISLELSDYKNSCMDLKKQLEVQADNQKQVDSLVKELSQKHDSLMQERAEMESLLKEARSEANKLQKDLIESKTLMNENSKEAQSMNLQSQQIRAEHDLQLSKLNGQIKRLKDESVEQQKYVAERTVEGRRLKNELETLQRRFDDLTTEHATFKERANYVLMQKNMDRTESSQMSNNKHEIDELIKTIQTRNDKITQLNEKCSFLEDEVQSAKEHTRNLKAELEDAHSQLNSLRTRGQEERRRTESDFEFRLRQALTDNDILQKQLSRTIEQYSLEKDKLIESFQRQNVDLDAENKDLKTKLEEYRELILQPRNATPNPVLLTPTKDAVQRRVQNQLSSRVQPINFNQTSYSASMMDHQPGLDHDNEEDDMKSLQDVINGAMEPDFGGGRAISSLDDVCSRPSVDFVSYEEHEALEKQLDHSRDLLNDMEDTNTKLLEQIRILKEEIRRLERNTAREEHVKNSEYLKNVVMKYLAPPKVLDERQQLLPVLTTILKLSPEEVSNITKFIKESMSRPEEPAGEGWSSLFSGIV